MGEAHARRSDGRLTLPDGRALSYVEIVCRTECRW